MAPNPCHQVSKVDKHGYQKNQMPVFLYITMVIRKFKCPVLKLYNHGYQKNSNALILIYNHGYQKIKIPIDDI